MTDRRRMWDERYTARAQVCSRGPNEEVERILADRPAGRALDLATGEGRHALWLAARGWQVTAVDFSAVGIARARELAAADGLEVDWQVGDVTTWQPDVGRRFDLVLVAFLHLDSSALRRAASRLAPDGVLVVVAHARRNFTDGVGGPRNPALLYSPDDLREAAAGLEIERCEEVVRRTDDGEAIDVVLVARAVTGP